MIDVAGAPAGELGFVNFSADCAVMSEGVETAINAAAAKVRRPVIFI